MATKRPEGLSPCYGSFVSPDILPSYKFRWTPSNTQNQYEIKIYNSSDVLVHTYAGYSPSSELDISSIGYAFTVGQTYYWTVKTFDSVGVQSDVSEKAKFIYVSLPQNPKITWSGTVPKAGDTITKGFRLDEIKNNLSILLSNYKYATSYVKNKAANLFTGNIVPSRKDFNDLQYIIEYIGGMEGIRYTVDGSRRVEVELNPTPNVYFEPRDPFFSPFSTGERSDEAAPYTLDVINWVGDGLGISDLQKVVDYIDYLTHIAPQPVKDITFTIPDMSMYKMININHASDGREDATFDLSWTVENPKPTIASINFTDLSPSNDIWFYDCQLAYGPGGQFKNRLFFRSTDIPNGTKTTFDMNWNGLFTENNLTTAILQFSIIAVDHYGNMSPEKTTSKSFNSNFKVPIGVSYFVLETQKTDLGSTSFSTGATWWRVTNTTASSYTYTTVDQMGKVWHRVKAVDKSGLETDWIYTASPIVYDPLRAPSAPKNFRVTSSSFTQINVAWDTVPTAESYDVECWPANPDGYGKWTTVNTSTYNNKLTHDTNYTFWVRARNRVGVSDWVPLYVKTPANIKEGYWDSVHCHTYNYSHGWKSNQGVGHTYAYAGNDNGNHAGLWYFDYGAIRSAIAGKTIMEVWVSVERLGTGSQDQKYPRFYTHNRDYASWYYNHSTAPGNLSSVGGAGSVDWGKPFNKNHRQWVKLPVQYGEWIRDNSATGLAIYEPDGSPYMKFHNWAQIYIKYK